MRRTVAVAIGAAVGAAIAAFLATWEARTVAPHGAQNAGNLECECTVVE